MIAEAQTGAFLGEDLLAYLLLAFGGAMLVGNLLAVFRPPPPPPGGAPRAGAADADDEAGTEVHRAPLGRSLAMAALGAVAFVWALASLVRG